MEIKILNTCIGCGACSEIAGEVFDMYTNFATVNEYKIDENVDHCFDAAIICPVSAIQLTA